MNVAIIGVPYDLDQPYTGMGKAPDALLDAGLARRLEALGCTTILAEMVDIPESDAPRVERLGQLLARLGYEVARARAAGFFPLILGGDCMTAIGTLAGLLDPADALQLLGIGPQKFRVGRVGLDCGGVGPDRKLRVVEELNIRDPRQELVRADGPDRGDVLPGEFALAQGEKGLGRRPAR